MGAEGGSAPPEFFSSHPNPDNRQEAIQLQIASWPATTYAGDSPEFADVRQHAAQVKACTAQEIKQGAKSGQLAALNQRNGATLNSAGASSFPTRSEAEAAESPKAVALESVLPVRRW